MVESKQIRMSAIVLIGVTVFCFWNTLKNPFLFDDIPNIQEKAAAHSWSRWWSELRRGGDRRPVVTASFVANWSLAPGKTVADVQRRLSIFHWTNIAIHATGGVVLFGLLRRLIGRRSDAPWNDQRVLELSFAIALLWLVHPLQTQAVTYLVQRFESLMGMFFLLALYSLVRGADATSPTAARGWHVAAALCGWASVFSKEVAIALFPVALGIDRIFLSKNWRETLTRRGFVHGTFALAAALLMLYTFGIGRVSIDESAGFNMAKMTPWMYLRSQGGAILHYLQLVIWPRWLCLDYGWPAATDPLAIWLPSSLVLALLVGGIALLWRSPRLAWVVISFFLILGPTSSILPIADICFEHRMYLPLACVLTLLVLTSDRLIDGFASSSTPSMLHGIKGALLLVVALLLGYRTILRNQDYHNEIHLWHKTAEVVPENPRVYRNLAFYYDRLGQNDEARVNYDKALELDPSAYKTLVEYGNYYLKLKDFRAAEEQYRRSLQVKADQIPARMNLGLAQMSQGQFATALESFREAWRECEKTKVEDRKVIRSLAWLLATAADDQVRNGAEAARWLAKLQVVETKPTSDFYDVSAAVAAENGQFAQAVELVRQAIEKGTAEKHPKLDDYRAHLALYEQQKPFRQSTGE